MPEKIDILEWRLERLMEDHKELEIEQAKAIEAIRTELTGVNDRLDRIIMVLLAGTFSVIVFFFGVAFALLTGQI